MPPPVGSSVVPSAADLSRKRLQSLYELSRSLPALVNVQELVNRLVSVAVESVKAERGILFLCDERGEARPAVVRAADSATVASALTISRRILEHALATGEATISDDARADPRFDSPSVTEYQIVSF